MPQKYFDLYPLEDVEAPKPFKGDLDDLPPLAKKKALSRKKHVHDQVMAVSTRKKAVQYSTCSPRIDPQAQLGNFAETTVKRDSAKSCDSEQKQKIAEAGLEPARSIRNSGF